MPNSTPHYPTLPARPPEFQVTSSLTTSSSALLILTTLATSFGVHSLKWSCWIWKWSWSCWDSVEQIPGKWSHWSWSCARIAIVALIWTGVIFTVRRIGADTTSHILQSSRALQWKRRIHDHIWSHSPPRVATTAQTMLTHAMQEDVDFDAHHFTSGFRHGTIPRSTTSYGTSNNHHEQVHQSRTEKWGSAAIAISVIKPRRGAKISYRNYDYSALSPPC